MVHSRLLAGSRPRMSSCRTTITVALPPPSQIDSNDLCSAHKSSALRSRFVRHSLLQCQNQTAISRALGRRGGLVFR